jgi:hypothetical protein
MMIVTTLGLLSFSIGLGLLVARATLDAIFRIALYVRPLLSRSL